MTGKPEATGPTAKAARGALAVLNLELIETRTALRAAGKQDAALAIDDARHSISRAMQDLRRAHTNGG